MMNFPRPTYDSFQPGAVAYYSIKILMIVAAVGFAHVAGLNFIDLEEIEIEGGEELELDDPAGVTARQSYQEYAQAIVQRNIFGAEAPKTTPAPPSPPPKTQLKLRLVGINTSSTGVPYAIIEDSAKKKQDVFELNEQVFEQAKLIAVHPTKVEIQRGGTVEVLELEDPKPGGGSATGDGGIQTLNDDQTEFTVPEKELEDALANLPQLLSQARAVPYFRNGKSVGMRLFAIRRGSLYEKLGLRNGDIIKAVNENSLSDPAQALKLFEQLRNERSVQVMLERAGVDMKLSYEID